MAEPTARSGPPIRRRRWLRWVLIALAILVVLPGIAVAVLVATFDPEALKPRIEAAAEQATGRKLTLGGPIRLKPSLVPTVTLDDVSLANMPGGSRPQMVTVRRVDIELALLPLLSRRVELQRLVLQAPDILLETDAQGHPNWSFGQPAQPAAPAAPAQPSEGGRSFGIDLGQVGITDGRITYRDGQTGQSRSLAIQRFQARTQGSDGALRLDGALALDQLPFTVQGQVGSIARLTGAGGAGPWPLDLTIASEGAKLAVQGSIAEPQQRKGWQFAVTAQVPDLTRFARVVPDVPLLPLHNLDLATKLADSGGGLPRISDLRLTVGESDLSLLRPGLRLTSLTATMPAMDQPLALQAEAVEGNTPLRLAGTLGAPALLLPGAAHQPWPLDLTAQVANATASAKGSVADPRALTGVDLAVSLRVPEVQALAPLAGMSLPPVKNLALDTRVAERGKGFEAGAFLRGLKLTSSAGDAAGDLTYVIGQRQGMTGQLASQRLDLDALRPPAAPGAPAAQPAPAVRDHRMIPDIPLPLEALRIIDSNLRWTVAELVAGGMTMRDAQLAVVIENGKARLDPFAATLPGGRLTLRGAADVTITPPTVQFAARSEGLDLAPLLAATKFPDRITGKLDLDADLRGQGRDLRAVAGSLFGHLGIAVVNGKLDARLLQAIPSQLRDVLLPQGTAGRDIALRCLALRANAESGMARIQALLLDTAIGKVAGQGGINLKDESLALRLVPDMQLGPARVQAPVHVGGTLAAPQPGISPEAAVAGGLGAFLSLQNTPDRTLQGLAQALGGGGGALPDCASQLAIARGGRAGPVPAAQAAPAPAQGAQQQAPAVRGVPKELQAPAQDLLRGLFGRGR
ncbi:MAG: AsmA family protein [Acetobacteraceae bacterium]|nr:AsmA family protein [Acetobacteraceae bacterium]